MTYDRRMRNINCENKLIDTTLKCIEIICVWTQEREIEMGMKEAQTFDCAFTKKRVTQCSEYSGGKKRTENLEECFLNYLP